MNRKAILFDMDGVLINTEVYLIRYWCQAAREAGFPATRAHGLQIRSLAGEYAAPLLQEWFGPEFDYQKIRSRRKELMKAHIAEHGIEMKPGVVELLTWLREKGIQTAVVTATDRERTTAYLQSIGIYDLFDRIICATEVPHGKPQPDVYLHACRELGLSPQDCLAVEDAPNGVLAAYRAGVPVVMVPDQSEPDEKLSGLLYDRAESLLALKEKLEACQGVPVSPSDAG
ncbi:MAG: HAD family phosphatase [Lachnospiraceae bacterium]|nr:HAD family phosphatase [Lachnospiraceae bacterium]